MPVVLVDTFRGRGVVPAPAITPNYDNVVAPNTPAARHDAVQRLLSFAATPSNRATAVGSTSLTATWLDLNIPTGSNVLCESAAGTSDACQNRIQGAMVYAALLMPAQGNYTLACGGVSNDGTSVDLATTQGTDYRNLGYGTPISSFCMANVPYGSNGVLASPAPNTLVNLRLAWNNWGNGAEMVIQWQPPGGGPAVNIPAANLYDPSDPATYLVAADDDFSGTPITAGSGATASVFGNDFFNVATPVSAGAGGTPANVQTYQLINDPASTPPPAGLSLNQDGTLSASAAVAPGNYTIYYQICRTDTQPNPLCAQASVRITVNPGPQSLAAATAVPTLGEWSIAGLGILLALGTLVGRRRPGGV